MKMAIRLLLLAKKHWWLLTVSSAALLLATACSLITPEIVRRLTAMLTSGTASEERLLALSLLLVSAYAVRGVCRFASMYYSHVAAWRFVSDLTFRLYDKLQTLSMRFFKDGQLGEMLSRTVNDTRLIEQMVAHSIPDLVSSMLTVIGVMIMLFVMNWKLALLTLAPVPLILYASTFFSRKVAPLFKYNQEVVGKINAELLDRISGMREIQAFHQEQRERDELDPLRREYARCNIHANFANAIYHPTVEFLTSVGTAIVVSVGGAMTMGGSMPISEVVGFFMYLSLFYQPLSTLARLAEDAQSCLAGSVRIFDILDQKSDVPELPNAKDFGTGDGSVEFRNVSFYYDPQNPVLRHVSFAVKPGQMVALVGPTGVGKTTLTSLLLRFYDASSGEVLLSGHNVREMTLASLRRQIALVPQDVFLFRGTVAQNIAFGKPDASKDEIVAAAVLANADSFIKAMPNGYDTMVGERGARLSGGQKQRIAIARAVLTEAPILVLDEATSAVDNATERKIQGAIDALSGKRTMIVIAHRLKTVERADLILVLQNGQVVERGTHRELLAKGGVYAEMARAGEAEDE